jgi:hypothetical protein
VKKRNLFFLISLLALQSALAEKPMVLNSYRSIDQENVPVWDEFVPVNDAANYEDQYDNGAQQNLGEWNWWNVSDATPQQQFIRDTFWNPDVDYNTFEPLTTRETLDNRNLILTDKRSCDIPDSVECKKWLATPHAIEKLPAGKDFVPVVHEQTDIEKEVEALLKQKTENMQSRENWKPTPVKNIWADNLEFQDCPFETIAECQIWKTKPTISETVSNRTPNISTLKVESIIALARAGNKITSDIEDAKGLVNRYRALMAASRACCTSGIVYHLQNAGASNGLVYKFLVDDANFYQFGERCLMITDNELDTSYSNTKTAEVVADVRNSCLCRRREYFESLLNPFLQVASASPEFASSSFDWQYTDGLKRKVTVSINKDVNAVLNQLENCPD